MVRYQVTLAYDGTAFSGMQRQHGARSVQSEVEEALHRIGWQGRSILAAGRTDAGVHASGQVIAFDLDWRHTHQDLRNALNANLPPDVAAREIQIVQDDFHPRFSATSRIYQYRIICQPLRDPLRERFAWRVWQAPVLEQLQSCARLLEGGHDFAAFGTPPRVGGSTIRQVHAAGWQQDGDTFVFEVSANAFLYHMVRRMVLAQVEVGQGRETFEVFSQYLSGKLPEMIQGLAPAQGLCLVKVIYPQTGHA